MYNALIRPHLDYCDVIYHIPSKQTQLGGVLNVLMEEVEKVQYQAGLAITGAWRVQVDLNSMKNWVGSPYLIVDGVGESSRFIRL